MDSTGPRGRWQNSNTTDQSRQFLSSYRPPAAIPSKQFPSIPAAVAPNIQHSSVGLVRFSWVEENEDDKDDEDVDILDIKVASYGRVITTPVTI